MHLIDMMSATAVKLIAIAALFSGSIGFLDYRHAKASDFKSLMSTRVMERVERYEEKVEETEDAINRIKVQHNLDDSQLLHLNQLNDRKAKYLRKIERVKTSPR